MRVHSNTSLEDFGYQLRDMAVRNNASPLMFDMIERIIDAEPQSEALEKEASDLSEKVEDLERDRDELLKSLQMLVENLPLTQPSAAEDPDFHRAVRDAKFSIERCTPKA